MQHRLDFYCHFLKVAQPYTAAGRSVIVTGDVNTAYAAIDIARRKENAKQSGFMPETRAARGEFAASGLIDTFRHQHPEAVKYTRWDQGPGARECNGGWRLDYIFVSPARRDRIVSPAVGDHVMGFDRCLITLPLD